MTSVSSSTPKRNILIFRSELLAYSETFIPSQAEKLQRFTPYYAGYKRLAGAALPADRTVGLPSYRNVGRARNFAAMFGLLDPAYRTSIARIEPALIHAHFEEGGIAAPPLAAQLGVPLFVTCHGYDVTVESPRRWVFLRSWLRRRLAALHARATRFLGVSRFICDAMIRRGYPASKTHLHYIGVDTQRFCPDPSIKPLPRVLYVGRLIEKKGCPDLLRAMAEVQRTYPEVELAIVGTGPLQAELEAFSREHCRNVRFLGRQPPETVLRLMRESLIFSVPSVRAADGDSEGLPIVNLEAQAVGLPVVSTRHAGIPEAVEDGVTGLLAAERSPAALAKNLLTLLNDDALRAKFGAMGRARIVRDFDLAKQSQLLEQQYLEFA